MSTLTVTAERLIIHPHPNADALELAQVGLYRAVVAKGMYVTGDYAVYVPEQAVLPADLIAELGLTGRLAGKTTDRVKAIRLRGELSQGIVCRPKQLTTVDLAAAAAARTDFACELGITKWIPPVPVHMSGEVEPAPELLRWIEIENIRRYPNLFEPGEPVTATEKIHGTACLFTYDARTDTGQVSSKGFGSRNLALKESDTNLYWRAARANGLADWARRVVAGIGATRVGIFGEVYGKGVQDLAYATPTDRTPGYAVFDVAVELNSEVQWLSRPQLVGATQIHGELPLAPELYEGPYDEALLIDLAEGPTVLGAGAHLREGIVVRPQRERRSPITGDRAIGKLVSEAYLTRKGATEYE